ncbi:gametocyte-specific factor 1-like [Hylaeus anthracinus]|uniref:gametocyte-specific factor 1-like n=1 Tax=Hylaeus volcanicus TaxID=313075 RepID=UPI0023B82AAC|nr:gametocyte-specific factor 1-like [Hylaeus volcanicus]XP_053998191.1 gametocyte-specific factor 1-like [Hylaeus anthracinus]
MYTCLKLLDPVVICPYNKNHLISKSRLQKHIVKCEKQYPEHYKILCPYNATHRLFKHELEEHIITCPARSVLQSEIYSEPKKHGSINFVFQSEVSSVIDCTENWDEEDENSKFLTDYESISDNNTETPEENLDSNVRKNIVKEKLRSPRGFSEAMLREANEDSYVEDLESVISSMGIGRGKIIQNENRLRLIGQGRGRPANTD